MGGNPMHSFWAGLYPGTPAERALEPYVAALGVPYRTQFPFFLWGVRFFPDVLFPTLGIILEIDDPSHDDDAKRTKDTQRSEALGALGWNVLRCTNDEALHRPQVVINRIRAALGTDGPLQHLALGPGLPPIPDYAKKSKRTKRRPSTRP